MTVNGFGTAVCGSRGDVGWGSCDAMECFVALYLPLIPYKAIHTFDWNGQRYRAIPIRWSLELVVRTFVGRWAFVLVVIGVCCLFGVLGDRSGLWPLWALLALLFVGLAVLAWVLLRVTDRRNKDIRRVLGANTIGNCDPAHLPDDLLEQMAGEPRLAYGTERFADAVELMLEQGSYARAMWAARVCVAQEDPHLGEELTDRILHDPQVVEALEEVRRDGRAWSRVMLSDEERNPPVGEPAEPVEDRRIAPARDEDDRERRVRGRRREDDDY
jgi:hypothetical protein